MLDKPCKNCQNDIRWQKQPSKAHGDNIAGIYDVLANCPQVQVDLLAEVPTSLDPSTWTRPNVPGYEPATALLQAQQVDGPSNGLFFEVSTLMQAPAGQSYFVVAVGISLKGNGVAFGVLATAASVAGKNPSRVRVNGQVNPVM